MDFNAKAGAFGFSCRKGNSFSFFNPGLLIYEGKWLISLTIDMLENKVIKLNLISINWTTLFITLYW